MLTIHNIAFMALSEGGHNGGLLDVVPGLMVWTIVTFAFLLLVLYKVAWKPILKSLGDREDFIKSSIEKAEQAQKEAEKILEENKANLAKADAEAQKIIEQGREYAEKLKTQAIAESKEEAKKMIEAATSEIERKTQEAMGKLKEQIVEIAVGAAEKIIKEELDEKKQAEVVNKYIDDLQKN